MEPKPLLKRMLRSLRIQIVRRLMKLIDLEAVGSVSISVYSQGNIADVYREEQYPSQTMQQDDQRH